jgi:hypothetical protein
MLNTSEVIKCAVACLLLSMLFSNAICAESRHVKTESAPPSFCPSTFYNVKLTRDASACHVFADELPASITYHSKLTSNELQHFFRQQIGGPVTQSLSQNRILIRQENDQTIIVISRDGTGSQVDILVTP